MDKNITQTHAYGKINLGLKVIEKLSSNYHKIETAFCFIEWHDILSIEKANTMSFHSFGIPVPKNNDNIIIKAYNLVIKECGLLDKYRVILQKRIPIGAGLGGGSSNAAAMLRLLNTNAKLGLTPDDMHYLAKYLGADVPFFLNNISCIGKNIGNHLTPFPNLQPNAYILTIYPNMEISTKSIYERYTNAKYEENTQSLEHYLRTLPPSMWHEYIVNDLEDIVFTQHPILNACKNALYDCGALYASLSGSGSALYGLFEQNFVAQAAFQMFTKMKYRVNLTTPRFKPYFKTQ